MESTLQRTAYFLYHQAIVTLYAIYHMQETGLLNTSRTCTTPDRDDTSDTATSLAFSRPVLWMDADDAERLTAQGREGQSGELTLPTWSDHSTACSSNATEVPCELLET